MLCICGVRAGAGAALSVCRTGFGGQGRQILPEHLQQLVGVDRFGDKIVHTAGQTLIAFGSCHVAPALMAMMGKSSCSSLRIRRVAL